MTREDQELIAEAYNQINEGLFDRIKARGAQAIDTVRGTGQQIKGKARQLAGSAVAGAGDYVARGIEAAGGTIDPSNNKIKQRGMELQKQGKREQASGARAGSESKYRSYINNSAKTIANDLKKLGMPVDDENQLISDLQEVIANHLQQVGGRSGKQFRDAGGRLGGSVVG